MHTPAPALFVSHDWNCCVFCGSSQGSRPEYRATRPLKPHVTVGRTWRFSLVDQESNSEVDHPNDGRRESWVKWFTSQSRALNANVGRCASHICRASLNPSCFGEVEALAGPSKVDRRT